MGRFPFKLCSLEVSLGYFHQIGLISTLGRSDLIVGDCLVTAGCLGSLLLE